MPTLLSKPLTDGPWRYDWTGALHPVEWCHQRLPLSPSSWLRDSGRPRRMPGI